MVTGALVIDLTVAPDSGSSRERRALRVLDDVPDGARVIVDMGQRDYLSHDACIWLGEHAERLIVEVWASDARALARTILDIRAGELRMPA